MQRIIATHEWKVARPFATVAAILSFPKPLKWLDTENIWISKKFKMFLFMHPKGFFGAPRVMGGGEVGGWSFFFPAQEAVPPPFPSPWLLFVGE